MRRCRRPAVVSAIALAAALTAACGGAPTAPLATSSTSVAAATTTAASTTSASPSSSADLGYAVTSTDVTITQKTPPATITYPRLTVTGGSDPAVRTAIAREVDAVTGALRKDFGDAITSGPGQPDATSEDRISISVQPRYGRLLTVEVDEYRYVSGAAHPNDTLDAVTVDLATGARVWTDSLFGDVQPVDAAVRKALKPKGVDDETAALITVARVKDASTKEHVASYPRQDGLRVRVSRCVAACALGPIETTVPWSALPRPRTPW